MHDTSMHAFQYMGKTTFSLPDSTHFKILKLKVLECLNESNMLWLTALIIDA